MSSSPVIQRKFTVIFPPGDIITSVLFEKEKNTKIDALISRLCQLRGLDLESLKFLSDTGEKLDSSKTVGEADLQFIEIIDRNEKKKKVEKVKEFSLGPNKELPPGIKLKLNECVSLSLEEQLFPNELEALKQMKQNYEICKNFSDEFVMACLFTRKLDLVRTNALLQSNWKWRKENNLEKIPLFKDLNPESFKYWKFPFGARCNDGSAPFINFLYLVTPNKEPYTITELAKFNHWLWTVGIFSQGMDIFRNGITLIVDLENYGWKNFDYEFQQKFDATTRDKIPARFRKYLVLHPPAVYNAMVKVASVFMKPKLIERLQTCSVKELPKVVEKSQLWDSFGGTNVVPEDRDFKLMKEWAEKNEQRLLAHQLK